MVFQEADLSVRVVRDIFSKQFERAIVDDEKQHHRLESFFTRTAPELLDRLELYKDDKNPLFEKYGVEEAIQSTLSRRVDLPSGGYLIIDYAEALTVIDVNSGSFTGRGKGARLEDTITKTNLEAASEVVAQLRLRDIGGIIVIDFIDMSRARNRDAVLKTLRKSLDEDRTKTYVVEISPLGLVEMTRQNVTEGVREILTKRCPTCDGRGRGALRGDRGDRRRAPSARAGGGAPGSGGVPHPDAPARRCAARRRARAPAARDRGGDRQALPLRGLGGAADRPLRRDPRGDAARRSSSARCPSSRARRCSSRSKSPTCTTRTTPWPSSAATSISVAGAGRMIGKKTLVRIEKVARSAASARLVEGADVVGRGRRQQRRRRGRLRVKRGGQADSPRTARWPRQAAQARERGVQGRRRESHRGARPHARQPEGSPAPIGYTHGSAPASVLGRLSSVMYAIVKVGGKQYRVEKGDSLLVDRMPEDEGAKVTLEPLLLAGGRQGRVLCSAATISAR